MEIKSLKKITDYRHLNMFEIHYLDVNNHEKTWQIASRNGQPKCVTQKFDIPDAVIIVPFHRQTDKLVIIREFRVPLGDYQYGFPAGLVDDGETVYEAAARELTEETGLTVTNFNKSSPPVYSSSGMTDESVSMVYVECAGEPSNEGNTGSEDIQTIFVSPEEARKLCRDTDIKVDVKTWLVLSVYGETGQI